MTERGGACRRAAASDPERAVSSRRPVPSRTGGSASVEYAVVTFAVVTALFVVPVTPAGETALAWLLEALRLFQDNTTYLLSLP